jgi:hypothetical protein
VRTHLVDNLAVRFLGGRGDIGIYGMAVLAYFSYGISVFSLKNCGITILPEILRYTVFAILDSKTAVIDKICLGITVLNTPQCPPHFYAWNNEFFMFYMNTLNMCSSL